MNTEIKAQVEAEGLIFLGAVDLEYAVDYGRFKQWIAERRHADLKYLEQHASVRENPSELLPGAKSAVVVGMSYFIDDASTSPKVARYAQFADYHKVLKAKAQRAASKIFAAESYRVTVDSAPILERALAARTSRGFIGKNTLYIHPDYGSFLLLGEIVTTQALAADVPAPISLDRKTREGGCGPCRQCQTACPTGALDRDYGLDASKCLSYWTIEHRGPIPEKFWPWMGEYYFGCDLCQLACPYNKKAKAPPSDWKRRKFPELDIVAQMSQAEYETHFGGTPMTRAKRTGLRRNALIAMAVIRHPKLPEVLGRVASDPDPVLQQTISQIHHAQLERFA